VPFELEHCRTGFLGAEDRLGSHIDRKVTEPLKVCRQNIGDSAHRVESQ
jgi:hypothetical protein